MHIVKNSIVFVEYGSGFKIISQNVKAHWFKMYNEILFLQ